MPVKHGMLVPLRMVSPESPARCGASDFPVLLTGPLVMPPRGSHTFSVRSPPGTSGCSPNSQSTAAPTTNVSASSSGPSAYVHNSPQHQPHHHMAAYPSDPPPTTDTSMIANTSLVSMASTIKPEECLGDAEELCILAETIDHT
jgi:hypothetical protein